MTAASAQFGDVKLIGYRVTNERVKAGEPIKVVTYWQRTRPAEPNDQTTLRAIVNLPTIGTGTLLGRGEAALGNDVYPSWAWSLNEIVMTRLTVIARAEASAVGEVQLGVRGNSAALIPSDQGETIGLGRVSVSAPHACSGLTPLNVTFGGSIKLIGYRLESDAIVLCWQSIESVPIDYTVFVHITDDQGQVSSADAPPRGGTYPTSVWLPGEQIEDSHALSIGPVKQITVGWYRSDTGERLPLDGSGATEFELIK